MKYARRASYRRWEEEEAGSRKKRASGVRESSAFSTKQILTHMLYGSSEMTGPHGGNRRKIP